MVTQSAIRPIFTQIVLIGLFASPLLADDWPQWMGPKRDGVYRETGIIKQIPKDGLPVLWRAEVANGYSGPAVADGRVFVTDYVIDSGEIRNLPDGRDKLQGTERVLCFDAKSGEQLWKVAYEEPYDISYPNGPRATPTVDEERLYVLGAEGAMLCLECESGQILWKRELADLFDAETPLWGHSAHPLVHGDFVYCLAGGEGSVAVALNKFTGEVAWKALDAKEIGYCPPTIIQAGGKQQLLIWHAESLNSLDPKTGKLYWTYPLQPRYSMSIAAPQLLGNRLYACAIGETAAMIELDESGKPADTLWTGKPKIGIYASNSTPLFEEDAIYGSDCGTGQYIAVNADNGDRFWETFELTTGGERRASHGTAYTVKHGDKHIIFAETGELIFVRLSPQGFEELGRTQIIEPTSECFGRSVNWSHPAFAQKCVFARNDKELICVSLSAND